MNFSEAKKIMELNKRFYDLMAEEFSRTRANVWEEFRSLSEYFQTGDKVLDLGCGNGRFFNLAVQPDRQVQYWGVDNSEKLIQLARQNYPAGQFVVGDGLELPFAEDFFDKVLCVAVLHHLPGYEMRREFLRQAHRTLKKGGLLVLAVWVAWPRRRYLGLAAKYFWLKLAGRSKLDWGDFYEPWDNKARSPSLSQQAVSGRGVRYFHNFSVSELRSLLEDSGFVIESLSFLDRLSGERNIIAIAKKS